MWVLAENVEAATYFNGHVDEMKFTTCLMQYNFILV